MSRRGFTLVELALVLVILGLIAVMVVPALVSSVRHEKKQEAQDHLLALRHAIIQWTKDHGGTLPVSLTATNLTRQDVWGRDYFYQRFESGDVCAPGSFAPQSLILDSQALNASFVLISHGEDTSRNIDTSPSPMDLSNPEDDLYTFVGHDELYYLICSSNTTKAAHNATKYVLYSTQVFSTPPAAMVIRQNSQVQGNIASVGSLAVLQNGVISGTIMAGSTVTMEQNTKAAGIVAAGAVTLQQNVIISGDIHAGGNVTIAQNTHVYGNVYANGTVTVQGTVHGNVVAAGVVTVNSPGNVTGTIQQNLGSPVPGLQPYQSPGIPKLQTFAATGPNISASTSLAPGNYGAVSIPANGFLILSSGTYILKSLTLGNNAQLRLNFNSTGTLQDISVFIKKSATFTSPKVSFSQDNANYTLATNASTAAAARIYWEAHSGIQVSGAATVWLGGILTNSTASITSKDFLGHVSAIPPGGLSLGSNTNYVYVPSHFAQANW